MSNLFSLSTNLLPYDGEVIDHGFIMHAEASNHYFDQLFSQIQWQNDEAVIMEKHYVTKRKVAWYADQPYSYTYSNVTKQALLWTDGLREIRTLVEQNTGAKYNSCLLNLYHDGSEGMAWHSDGEKMLVRHGSIASLSLGATRKFSFKHKVSKERVDCVLAPGSLIEMRGKTQDHWLHRLPPTKKVATPRINLTFRQMDKKR